MFGKLIEQELLGSVKKEKLEFGRLHEIEAEYLGYRPSLDYVKSHQRGDPFNPKRFFPKSLLEGLRTSSFFDSLNIEQIAFYTAVDSVLDKFHGVDAFFEYKIKEGGTLRVTIDVTTNPNKDKHRADVILAIPKEGLDPSDHDYQELVERYINQIEQCFLTKINK